DAIDQVTGSKSAYGKNLAPAGTRAIGLAPTRLGGGRPAYPLQIFRRPLRTQTCGPERSRPAGPPRARCPVNGSGGHPKIGAPSGSLAKLLKAVADDQKAVEELYLSTICRLPSADEMKRSLAYVAKAADRSAGFEDVLWSLINLREFVFNH